ncbi:MAG TPA: PfkB family carbohydrate kinase [Gaiellaceae bacterium]|nr:PfkB family carbohydrate kinase [Gaiellaceae bacterium]
MPRIAVVGNVSLDVVDGRAPSAGGGPTFAAEAFRRLGEEGQVVTRYAAPEASLFGALGPAVALPAGATSGFAIDHDSEARAMQVTAEGARWSPADAAAVAEDVEWVHVAPLLRGEFPAETLAALATGRRLSLDGQGLVRVPAVGPLREDAGFDAAVLDHVTVLKLSEHEAGIVAGGHFDLDAAARLGVPEVLLTLGSRGAVVFADGRVTPIEPAAPVTDVHATGAGDTFAIGYAVARLDGAEPVDAARSAAALVSGVLADRLSRPGSIW